MLFFTYIMRESLSFLTDVQFKVVKVVIWSFGHLVIFDFGWSFLFTIIINIYIYIIVSDFDK